MKRKWPQFSLKTLLGIVFILSLPLGWYSYERYSYQQRWKNEWSAISQLCEQGAILFHDHRIILESSRPDWVRRLIGDKYPERIAGIAFEGECTAESLSLLPKLNRLNIEIIFMHECQIDASGLKHLRECRQLKRIRITGGNLNGNGFEQIFCIPTLETLRVEDIQLPTDTLNSIDQALELQSLQLSGMTIDAEAIKRIGSLPQLRDLWLGDGKLFDLSGLNDSEKIEVLDLTGSNLTDTLLANLKRLPKLHELILDQTNITPASLPHLTRFEGLENLAMDRLTLRPQDLSILRTMPKLQSVVDSTGAITLKPSIPTQPDRAESYDP